METNLTRADWARYPFTNETAEYIKSLGVNISDLTSGILDTAERKVNEALMTGRISTDGQDADENILTYLAALMMLAMAGDERAKRRYALAESKRTYELLIQEKPSLLLQIAKHTFGWKAKIVEKPIGEVIYDFAVFYPDYLKNAVRIRDLDWKITNRVLEKGYVYCDRDGFARLLEEEIEARILSKVTDYHAVVPDTLAPRVEKLKKLALSQAQLYAEDIPKVVLITAMPPCVKALLSNISSGKHVPHMGRFAAASFLSHIGVSDEEIVKMFSPQSDFIERIARYQVEHITGKRGGQKKYLPPNCKTMKTHGICINPDELCKTINHPLSYYRKKAKTITITEKKKQAPAPPKPAA